MLTLNDGRDELWQWDTGRTLTVDADCSQVHFSNKVFGRSIDVDVVDGIAIIPDILLQTDKDLNAWAFVGTAENGYTKISKTFKVNRRNKPSDYVFTPQEQITLKDATAILGEAKDVANEAMETAKKAEASADKAAQIADEMKKLADQVEQNTDTATKAKADALTAQTKAEDARNAAETARKAAEDAANNAGDDASTASAAATRAQNAANDAAAALDSIRVLYQDMQEYVSQSIQDIQTEGNTQVQRVQEEGTAQISAAKEQADRAQAEADRAEAARANAEDVVESCIPDDTAVDGKPWTSKKIVDSLCQPFEESGNPVQVYPVENYPLDVKVRWEPVQEGSGDPSPDNIRPIKGRDRVTVERCGENLFDTRNIDKTLRGVHITSDESGAITLEGTKTGTGCITVADVYCPAGKYYFKTTDRNCLTALVGYTDKGVGVITLSAPNYIRIGVKGNDYSEAKTVLASLTYGIDQPDTYSAYTGSTIDIALPETVYGGEVDAVSSEGQETWKTLTLDGTEEWMLSNDYFEVAYRDLGIPSSKNNIAAAKLSQHADRYIIDNPYGNTSADKCAWVYSTMAKPYANLRIKHEAEQSTLENWKSYLASQYAAGTPMQIAYKLAEPVPFNATGAHPIPALSGMNTIYTDADSVVVTGAEDPKHTITELKNAIISLGGNV